MKITDSKIAFTKYDLFFFLFCSFMCVNCQNSNTNIEPLAPTLPKIDVKIIRYDQLLKTESDDVLAQFEKLTKQYPAFSNLYKNTLIEAEDDATLIRELTLIQSDSSYQNLYDAVQDKYEDLSKLKPQLAQTLENYGEIFNIPEDRLPWIYTFISGFAYQAFLFDDNGKNGMGLGLDMFLSSDFPYTGIHSANPLFSDYLVRTYNEDHIVKKLAEVLVEDQMHPPSKSDFLSLMIWGGMKLYVIDELLNFASDTIVMEYTQKQLDWCRGSELQMWDFFFENDLFYETDLKKFSKLIGPSPSTPGMPPESPGRTGNYMGWQIVKAYMKRNPHLTIPDLLSIRDAQEILNDSKYKPRRS